MMSLNYHMVLILYQIFQIILNKSLKNLKHKQQFLPLHAYIDKTNNRLVLKMKDWQMLEIQTPETMKLFGSTKN